MSNSSDYTRNITLVEDTRNHSTKEGFLYLIPHSDVYLSKIIPSIRNSINSYDNAIIKSFNKPLKDKPD